MNEKINEGRLYQTFIGFYKFNERETNTAKIIKAHEYKWFLDLIDHTDDINDLLYLRQDLNAGLDLYATIGERIDMCIKYGDCPKTHKYYKGIKKKYIDRGVTSKDCELISKWFKEVAQPALNEKIKETRKTQVESVVDMKSLSDLKIL